jgi:hypothetical protein
MLSTATSFAGDPWPLTTAMLEASIPRRSASRATTASLARPFSGAANQLALPVFGLRVLSHFSL